MSGSAPILPLIQFTNALGAAVESGTVTTYVAGSLTLTPTWQDEDLTILNTNPIQLDSSGQALIFLDPSIKYKFLLKNAFGATVPGWPVDDISNAQAASIAASAALAASGGSALVGFLQDGTGASLRTVQDKLRDVVSAKDFGLAEGNTGAQNVTAIDKAIAYASAQGGLTLYIPRGTYDFNASISLDGVDNLRITGDGIDATILRITHATTDFIVCGSAIYQTIDNLTLTSSVTRTAGSMVTAGYWQRGLIERVKITQHFNGIHLTTFEECYVVRCSIVDPTGAGSCIIAGTAAASNQGANLHILNCFMRGNEDTQGGSPTVIGKYGLSLYDVQAVYAIDCDMGAFTNNVMLVEPTTACENCHFLQCYFDTTTLGENVAVLGAGLKRAFQFNGCWFASAGRYTLPGAADCEGVLLSNNGTYSDWNFTGCRFNATSGPGISIFTPDADLTITGCVFKTCAANSTLLTSIYLNPAATQTEPMLVSGCKFTPAVSSTSDIEIANALGVGNTISGCVMPLGVSYVGGSTFGNVAGVSDSGVSDSVASAATLQISPTRSYYYVTGTTNVGGLYETYTGHIVSFTAVTGFTWQNGGALALKGASNFVASAGNVLTLVCRADGAWQEISRSA
jgi:hypothetical protein